MVKRKYIWIIGILVIAGILFLVIPKTKVTGYAILNELEEDIIIYKSSGCGCCSIYGNYFKSKVDFNVEVIDVEDVDSIKTEYGVPLELRSCHTTIIGDYFIEGHVPLEAITKLLEEKPNIAGIAMSGMPSGSPGMPGVKKEDFVIYAVNHDQSFEEFMRI